MYQPPHFREDRPEVLYAAIRSHPLGLMISHGGAPEAVSADEGGLMANPIPFLVETGPDGAVLHAHMARANPQWRAASNRPVLVVFQGPAHYVSPSWYATKQETHKVVPTWNYVVVQVRGVLSVTEDRGALHGLVSRLTAHQEIGRAEPWAVTDAPESFIDGQLKGIVGLSIPVVAITGKWKMSQNRPAADRVGVAAGLAAEETDEARATAELIPQG